MMNHKIRDVHGEKDGRASVRAVGACGGGAPAAL